MPETTLPLKVGSTLGSGLAWSGSWFLNQSADSLMNYAPGIDLVYLPAGVRLLLVLVLGVWGAAGVALANPLMFLVTFPAGTAPEALVNSVISGFAPLATVRLFFLASGTRPSLENLRPIHLPLLALAVSVVTPLLLNLQFVALGREPVASFWGSVTAMALGDFAGCVLVIVLARLLIAAFRGLARRVN